MTEDVNTKAAGPAAKGKPRALMHARMFGEPDEPFVWVRHEGRWKLVPEKERRRYEEDGKCMRA
ncbi:MAG: hypothetical protein HQ559_04270 [Lentisphaerae bacterium]|nr:hypothetical protein [Lentisphaerota bacterium]